METRQKNLPHKKIRAGAVAATIWKNETTNSANEQAYYYSVSLDRSYKDKNNEWKNTSSLRASDIPKAVLVLNKAFEYLAMENPDRGMTTQERSSQSTTTTSSEQTVDVEELDAIM